MKKILSIGCFALLASLYCNAQRPLDVGSQVPGFSLDDQDGKTYNMKDSLGNNIFVIFFYPKDESFIDAKEACAFRDSMNAFKQFGAMVIGINNGTVDSHKKFQTDDKLNYELLSDPDDKVIKQFGVKKGLFTQRMTFVVDINGQIVFKTESNTEGAKHVHEVLNFLRTMKKKGM